MKLIKRYRPKTKANKPINILHFTFYILHILQFTFDRKSEFI